MQQQEPRPEPFLTQLRNNTDVFLWVCAAHCATIYAFSRSRFGLRAMGTSSAMGAAMILVYAGFMNSPLMINYLMLYLAALLFRRITYRRVERSTYDGWPWLASTLLFGCRNERILLIVEPMICAAAGMFLMENVNRALGLYVTYGALTMTVKHGHELATIRNWKIAQRDAEGDMEALRRLRERRY